MKSETVFVIGLALLAAGCFSPAEKKKLGQACAGHEQCASGFCVDWGGGHLCSKPNPCASDEECAGGATVLACEDLGGRGRYCVPPGQGNACIPQCEGRECGDNKCGGGCGDCPAERSMCNTVTGLCAVECVAACAGRPCGDDGCGGGCGDCPAETPVCRNDTGQCETECVRDCGERECGDDGCDGECGACGVSEKCVAGKCEPACAGVAITTDGVLDIDIRTVAISGRVTRNGEDIPSDGEWRGELLIVNEEGRRGVLADLGDSGPVTYAGRIFPGKYDIVYSPASTSIGRCSQVLPCQGAVVRSGQQLFSNGVLDVDLRVVEVSGAVTRNGAQMPSDGEWRGSLSVVDAKGNTGGFADLGDTGAVDYHALLFAGTFDVVYTPRSTSPGDCGAVLPCQAAIAKRGQQILSGGVLDIDLRVVEITGAVTRNGAQMPSDGEWRGSLSVVDEDGRSGGFADLGRSGTATYHALLFPGAYDINYSPRSAGPGECGMILPCQGTVVRSSQQFFSNGVLDLDMRVVEISGAVTRNGRPMPQDDGWRGMLTAVDSKGGSVGIADFGSAGAVSYDAILFPGLYDIIYTSRSTDPADCGSVMPCMGGKMRGGQQVSSDGVLDLDLRVVSVSGVVTRNGSEMPAGDRWRGSLSVSDPEGSSGGFADLGQSGPASYAVVLFPGTYDVKYAPYSTNPADCGSALPCQSAVVRSGQQILADGVLDVNLSVIEVSGRVTRNGSQIPSDGNWRGSLSVVDAKGNTGGFADLGYEGPADYEAVVFGGTYDIAYAPNGTDRPDCSDIMPCMSTVARRGQQLLASGVLDLDLSVIGVSGAVTRDGGAIPSDGKWRGRIAIADPEGSAGVLADLEESGAVSYNTRLFPGNYVVSFQSGDSAAYCSEVLPCQGAVLMGCE